MGKFIINDHFFQYQNNNGMYFVSLNIEKSANIKSMIIDSLKVNKLEDLISLYPYINLVLDSNNNLIDNTNAPYDAKITNFYHILNNMILDGTTYLLDKNEYNEYFDYHNIDKLRLAFNTADRTKKFKEVDKSMVTVPEKQYHILSNRTLNPKPIPIPNANWHPNKDINGNYITMNNVTPNNNIYSNNSALPPPYHYTGVINDINANKNPYSYITPYKTIDNVLNSNPYSYNNTLNFGNNIFF